MDSRPAAKAFSSSGSLPQALDAEVTSASVPNAVSPPRGPNWLVSISLSLLGTFAIVSLAFGLRQGLNGGIDFQWSGARLLAEGMDPWKTFLEGDPNRRIILGQQPNYLHELYVLLLPLGKMSFHRALTLWCMANLAFLGISLSLTSKLYRLSSRNALIMSSLVLSSAPLRVSLANGQQSLFTLCCFAVAFTMSSRSLRGGALGIGFAKYSFAPVVIFVDVIRRRWLSLFCVGVPILCGLFVVWYMTGTPLSVLATEPLRSAQMSVSPGYGDVMTGVQIAFVRSAFRADYSFRLTSAVGFIGALAFACLIAIRRIDRNSEIALIAITTLFCFKHLIYDYVFLLFPVAFLLHLEQRDGHLRTSWRIKAGWAALLYLLFGGTLQNRLHMTGSLLSVASNASALLLIAYVVYVHSLRRTSRIDLSV